MNNSSNNLENEASLDFEEFYNRYYSSAYFYTLKKTGSSSDTEDLVSETFLYCFRHFDDYDPLKSSRSTWLYLVLNSRIKNYYRDRKEYVEINELENYLFDDMSLTDKAVVMEETRATLAEAIKALPEKQQRAVIMRYFQQKDYEDIAYAIGSSPGNARVVVSRALDKLRLICQPLFNT